MTPRALAIAAIAAILASPVAAPARAAGGARHVLAWPPTRYVSAELILWLDDPSRGATVRVTGRGLDSTLDLAGPESVRLPLPSSAQCRAGRDACAIVAERVAGEGDVLVALQSPATAGAADTLLLTAHDTALIPPGSEASQAVMLLSLANPATAAFPQSASVASIVPARWPARVSVSPSCDPTREAVLEAGEVLTLSCAGPGDDLSGTEVTSDAPVVALSGNVVTCIPWDGSGLSGDLALDVAPARRSGPTTIVAPVLPRQAALAGRGDLVRVLALEDARVTFADATGPRALDLVAGQVLDVDTAAPGGDLALRVDSTGAVAAWHVPKSRAERGLGDPAAVPLVPRQAFTRRARFFAPDGYAEANVLVIVAEPGASVTLDGVRVPGFAAAPGSGLEQAVVSLPAPAAGTGTVHDLAGDAPFGAWVVGFGGYKAHGMTAAAQWPAAPPPTIVRRGVSANALAEAGLTTAREWTDVDAGADRLVFYDVSDEAATLAVSRCGAEACLRW